jgi:hypothetical protein
MDANDIDNGGGLGLEALHDLDRRRALTAEYSRYSRNAGGLGSLVGGALCAIAFLLDRMTTLPNAARFALAATPLVWIAVKEWLRRRLYQRFGVVEEAWTPEERRMHHRRTGVLAVASGLLVAVAFYYARFAQVIGFVAMIIAMPIFSARFLRSREEFRVGVLLFCQAAFMLSGGRLGYAFLVAAVVFSASAIAVGLRQHRAFRRIARELSELGPVS